MAPQDGGAVGPGRGVGGLPPLRLLLPPLLAGTVRTAAAAAGSEPGGRLAPAICTRRRASSALLRRPARLQEELAGDDPQAQAEQMLKMRTAKIKKAR